MVRLLLRRGAQPNTPSIRGYTALGTAVKHDHLDIVKLLLHHGASLRQGANGTKMVAPPILVAAGEGNVAMIACLLEARSSIEAKGSKGETPLHCAVLSGHLSVVRYLISKGANVNSRENEGQTPLFRADSRIAGGSDLDGIFRALVKAGADIEARDSFGETALIRYARRCFLAPAKAILDLGANVNAESYDGDSALGYATREGHEEMVRLLLSRRASVATSYGYPRLLDAVAAEKSRLQICTLFLDVGRANVNAVHPITGYTALHIAAASGDASVSRLLLGRGADISKRDNNGYKAYEFARNQGHVDLAQQLRPRSRWW